MPAVSQVHTDSRQTFKVVSFESKLSYEKSMDIFFLPPHRKCLSLEGSRFEKLLINGVFRITIEFVIFPSHCISARVTRKFWSR